MEMGRSTEKSSIDPASHHPKKVVTIQRNRWTVCSGMGGHNAAEYATTPTVEVETYEITGSSRKATMSSLQLREMLALINNIVSRFKV